MKVENCLLCRYQNICLESYLDILKIPKFRNTLSSLRIFCHMLEIEKGRHRDIDRFFRKCRFCPNRIEEEYHFLLLCKQYEALRCDYLPNKYFERSNLHRLTILMSSKKEYKEYCFIYILCKFETFESISKHVAIEYVIHVPYCMFCIICCIYCVVGRWPLSRNKLMRSLIKNTASLTGFEPKIPWTEIQCSNHWAALTTGPKG